MNSNTHQRILRTFLALLLQSDLSIAEMQTLARELEDGSFLKELSALLREMIFYLEERNEPGKSTPDQTNDSRKALARSIIVKRRLPRKAVAQLMMLASPGMRQDALPTSGTTGHLLEKYFSLANQFEIDKFLSILAGEPADAYIQGISQRNRVK
jgi:hypothetical protein